MNEQEIIERWTNSSGGFGQVEVWDEAAQGYAAKPIPTFKEDPFLKMIGSEGALSSDMSVLDMGCGAGLYSIAIAPFVRSVTGCDISPKMVEAANKKADEAGCANVRFVCGDFADIVFTKPFDLVFAHFTPALGSASAFQKMMSLAKKWCFVAMPTRRTDFLLQELRQLVGVPLKDNKRDENFLYAFSLAWLAGKTPSVVHYDDVWTDKRTLEEAQTVYSEHLVATDLREEQKTIVKNHLASIAQDGMVFERIETTVVMMGWRM